MRLGDFDALKAILFNDTQYGFWHDSMDGSDVAYTQRDIFKCIDSMPTIDAVPVVHGRWLDTGCFSSNKSPIFLCSVCRKEVYDYYIKEHKFCLHCGARMDGEG